MGEEGKLERGTLLDMRLRPQGGGLGPRRSYQACSGFSLLEPTSPRRSVLPRVYPLLLISPLAPQALLISCTPLSLLFYPPSPPSLPNVTPSNSLHFPLTDIDWPLGGFPSSPLTATGSSLLPSGTVNFLPVQSCVSLYSRAWGARMGWRGQRTRFQGAPAPLCRLQSLFPHGAMFHLASLFF